MLNAVADILVFAGMNTVVLPVALPPVPAFTLSVAVALTVVLVWLVRYLIIMVPEPPLHEAAVFQPLPPPPPVPFTPFPHAVCPSHPPLPPELLPPVVAPPSPDEVAPPPPPE